MQHTINCEVPDPVAPLIEPRPIQKRRRWVWIVAVLATIVVVAAIVFRIYADDMVARRMRPATIELLEERFLSDVELAGLTVSVFPTLAIQGQGLVLRHKEHRDIPPLIAMDTFTVESSIGELWTRHIDRVHLTGLHITIPPRRRKDMPSLGGREDTPPGEDGEADDADDVRIHELVSEKGLLTIMSKRGDKPPREFTLSHLRFEDLNFDKPSAFEASLTNPVPEGVINTVGTFGPWNAEEPSDTPITGTFRFAADLGTIKGIGGALQAEGSFSGPLERISTEGRTKTENFHLSTGGVQFPLLVDYKASVDGTLGDTILDVVEADLGKSHISAQGAVVRMKDVKGRRVTLKTQVRDGRIEDFIRLATRVKSAPIVGAVNVTATLDVPPGEAEVLDRMDLRGSFSLPSARFTSESVQARIDELSRRGQGRPSEGAIDDVASNMRGEFHLHDGVLELPNLTFRVDGAEVWLTGRYAVRSEQLDFRGELRLQARMSQTLTGWKSLVLRMFDPMFDSKGAGTVLPIVHLGYACTAEVRPQRQEGAATRKLSGHRTLGTAAPAALRHRGTCGTRGTCVCVG